jgi:hypothetical protein
VQELSMTSAPSLGPLGNQNASLCDPVKQVGMDKVDKVGNWRSGVIDDEAIY